MHIIVYLASKFYFTVFGHTYGEFSNADNLIKKPNTLQQIFDNGRVNSVNLCNIKTLREIGKYIKKIQKL